MENTDDVKTKRNSNCGICGELLGTDYIRCPLDGKICHPKCSEKIYDKQIDADRMICKDCNARIHLQAEKEKSESTMTKLKIIVALIATLLIFLLVKKWF